MDDADGNPLAVGDLVENLKGGRAIGLRLTIQSMDDTFLNMGGQRKWLPTSVRKVGGGLRYWLYYVTGTYYDREFSTIQELNRFVQAEHPDAIEYRVVIYRGDKT